MPGFFSHADIWGNQVLAGIVAGALCGYLGVWVVLRRVVFVAAALGEVAGLGVVMAFYLAAQLALPEPHPGGGTPAVAAETPPAAAEAGTSPTDAGATPAAPSPPSSTVVSDDDLTALLGQVGVEDPGLAMGAAGLDAGEASPDATASSPDAESANGRPAPAPSAVFDEQGVRPYLASADAAERDAAAGGAAETVPAPPWLQPMVVAVVFVVLASVLLSIAPRFRRITQESVVGLAYLLAAGLVVLVGSRIPQGTHEIRHVLYGDSVSLDASQLHGLLVAGAAVLLAHGLFFKEFLFVSFDPETAQASGVRTRSMSVLLLVTIGIVIASASRAVGALPVFAFLVLPPVAALLVASSLRAVLIWSAAFGALASVLGYYLAWIWSFPAGASRVVTAAVLLGPALVVRRLRGN